MAPNGRIILNEIFFSLQGESSRQGLPCVLIRLTGCNLRCGYCDTTYAFTGGQTMALQSILQKVAQHSPRFVTVTGGEPLAQKNSLLLMRELCDAGYEVSLETGGMLDVSMVDERVAKVVDLKTPASGEMAKNLLSNLEHLNPQDEIKFVLCGEADYQWARQMMHEHRLSQRCDVLFSPAQGQLAPKDLAEWILRDHLPVRLQVQLHKILWGNEAGH